MAGIAECVYRTQAPAAIAPLSKYNVERKWQQYPLLILYEVCAIEQSFIYFFSQCEQATTAALHCTLLLYGLHATITFCFFFSCWRCSDICINDFYFYLNNQFAGHTIFIRPKYVAHRLASCVNFYE